MLCIGQTGTVPAGVQTPSVTVTSAEAPHIQNLELSIPPNAISARHFAHSSLAGESFTGCPQILHAQGRRRSRGAIGSRCHRNGRPRAKRPYSTPFRTGASKGAKTALSGAIRGRLSPPSTWPRADERSGAPISPVGDPSRAALSHESCGQGPTPSCMSRQAPDSFVKH
jgi:hypothetical protein